MIRETAVWHTIVIALHAAGGGVAFLAGCVAIGRRALFGPYLWGLVAMEAGLVLAIVTDWPAIGVTARTIFVAFALLGVFMLWRADRARRIRPREGARPPAGYVDHVGFTLVALFDAFTVILVLDLTGRAWPAAVAGVVIAVAGHFVLRAARARLTGPVADRTRAAGAPSS